MNDELYHYGIKGQKWGVRRFQNKDGSLTPKGTKRYGEEHSRTLKKGTVIQNISRRKLDPNSDKASRIYAAYTDSDKAEYVDMMANYEYDGRGYKNSFRVKKDIKIASEREAVKTLNEMYKDDPDLVSSTMAKAYNAVNAPIIFSKSKRYFDKNLKKMSKDPSTKQSLELGRQFLKTVPMTSKTSDLANKFYSRMVKKGFDAVLDPNDAYNIGATQDPLIIFNTGKLDRGTSVKLSKKDLDAAFDYVNSRKFKKEKREASSLAHSIQNGGNTWQKEY